MTQLLALSLLQCVLLSGAQVFLKMAMNQMGTPSWSLRFVAQNLTNWPLLGSGLCFGSAALLWLYILKNFPLSQAYPLTSLSYVIGVAAAIVCFHEQVPPIRWVGVALIVVGCVLIAKP